MIILGLVRLKVHQRIKAQGQNQKGGKFTKLKWFFKKQKLRPGGQGPSPHEHTLQHTLEPSFAQVVVGGQNIRKILKEHGH